MTSIAAATAPEDEILFTFGRMNPPTTGHKKLVQEIMEEAVNQNVKDVYIILSPSQNFKKNPLSYSEKKTILETMITQIKNDNQHLENIQVNIPELESKDQNCKSRRWPIKQICDIKVNSNISNFKAFLGTDRIEDFDWLIDTLHKDMINLTIKEVARNELEDISASMVRAFARSGNDDALSEFSKLYETSGLSETMVTRLFHRLNEKEAKGTKKRRRRKSKKKHKSKKIRKTKYKRKGTKRRRR